MLPIHRVGRAVLRAVTPVLILACGTTDPDTGNFTMAARVNGGSWAPGGTGTTPPTATFYEGDHTLVFGGTQSGVSPKTRGINVQARNVIGAGSYPLVAASDSQGSAIYTESNGSIFDGDFTFTFYWTSATRTGAVIVTDLDMARQNISGTFSFDAATPQGQVVIISGGTFSGRFATLPGSAPE
jgi:hypothetical protein